MSDKEIIFWALKEYEENHYDSNDDKWQKQMNKLIEKYR